MAPACARRTWPEHMHATLPGREYDCLIVCKIHLHWTGSDKSKHSCTDPTA